MYADVWSDSLRVYGAAGLSRCVCLLISSWLLQYMGGEKVASHCFYGIEAVDGVGPIIRLHNGILILVYLKMQKIWYYGWVTVVHLLSLMGRRKFIG